MTYPQTFTQLEKPMELSWTEFSIQTLKEGAASGRPVIFDLSNMNEISGVLEGTSYTNAVTSPELRFIQANWESFGGVVEFVENGASVGAPW